MTKVFKAFSETTQPGRGDGFKSGTKDHFKEPPFPKI